MTFRLKANRRQPKPGQSLNVRVHFPGGHARHDAVDFTALLRAGAIRVWRDDLGRTCVQFATPYEAVRLRGPVETLTVEKAVLLRAAMAHFGATPTEVPPDAQS